MVSDRSELHDMKKNVKMVKINPSEAEVLISKSTLQLIWAKNLVVWATKQRDTRLF